MAGLAHAPKNLDETIGQALAAAGRAGVVLSKEKLSVSGIISKEYDIPPEDLKKFKEKKNENQGVSFIIFMIIFFFFVLPAFSKSKGKGGSIFWGGGGFGGGSSGGFGGFSGGGGSFGGGGASGGW